MAKTQRQLNAEERLNKALADQAALEADLHLTLFPSKVWTFVEIIVRQNLSRGDSTNRTLVAEMALACRREAMARFGHDTMETFVLAKLLRAEATGWVPKTPRVDAITHINSASHEPQRLSAGQDSAATSIRQVWDAFGKFLEVSARSIGGGGSSRASALSPVDVMGEDLWAHHRDVFSPWETAAARTVVERRAAGGDHLTIAAVVFKVLVGDAYPEELDGHYALIGGTALKALKAGLNAYHDPAKLAQWGKRPPQGQNAPQTGGQGGQTGGAVVLDPGQGAKASPAPAKRPPGLWQPPRPKLAPGERVKLRPRKKDKTGA